MTDSEMMAALMRLPEADLLTETKIDDQLGDGTYYSARTVARLLDEQHQAIDRLLALDLENDGATCDWEELQAALKALRDARTPQALLDR